MSAAPASSVATLECAKKSGEQASRPALNRPQSAELEGQKCKQHQRCQDGQGDVHAARREQVAHHPLRRMAPQRVLPAVALSRSNRWLDSIQRSRHQPLRQKRLFAVDTIPTKTHDPRGPGEIGRLIDRVTVMSRRVVEHTDLSNEHDAKRHADPHPLHRQRPATRRASARSSPPSSRVSTRKTKLKARHYSKRSHPWTKPLGSHTMGISSVNATPAPTLSAVLSESEAPKMRHTITKETKAPNQGAADRCRRGAHVPRPHAERNDDRCEPCDQSDQSPGQRSRARLRCSW